MTKKEFYLAVAAANVAEEIKAFAQAEADKIDTVNEKRKVNPTGKQKENAELNASVKDAIYAALDTVPTLVSTIKEKLAQNGINVSPQRINILARQLVDEGKIVATKVKVPTKGEQRAYAKV